jgi:hypothetical protein
MRAAMRERMISIMARGSTIMVLVMTRLVVPSAQLQSTDLGLAAVRD